MSRKVAHFLKLALATLALAASPAFAQLTCGTTLYQSIALKQDLDCTHLISGAALEIGADNVRIDLNGFRIFGIGWWMSTTAIRSSGFSGVHVVGPGSIVDFGEVMNIQYGRRHVVSGVSGSIAWSTPLVMSYASDSMIIDSEFVGLVMHAFPGFPARRNQILRNRFGTVPGAGGGGMYLSGCGLTDNVIAGNVVDGTGSVLAFANFAFGDGAQHNEISDNKVYGSMWIHNASENWITGNIVKADGAPQALKVTSGPPHVPCNPSDNSTHNKITDNDFVGGLYGVVLGTGTKGPVPAMEVRYNYVFGNRIQDSQSVGLYFMTTAIGNDGRGNTYSGVPIEVTDAGVGNFWP